MALNYNTESFVKIAEDLKNQVNNNNLPKSQIDNYLRSKYDVTADEYYNAVDEALEAEEKYFEMKEEFEDSPLSFLGIGSTFIPAHLRDQELSTFQAIFDFPGKLIQSGIRGSASGIAQLAEMALPKEATEAISDVADKVDESLSDNRIYKALQTTFDPATNVAEEVGGELGSIFLAGGALTKGITKLAPKLAKKETLGGAVPAVAGFTAADIIVTDKNESLANTIIDIFPDSEPILENIAINPDDADSIKILKKALEGTVLGSITEGAIRAAAPLIRKIRAKNKAINEDGVLQPPKDDTGKIKETEVVERPDGSYQQKVSVQQPIKLLTPEYATESKNWLSRFGTSRQGFDEESFKALEKLENTLRGETKVAELYGRKFTDVLEKEFGKPFNQIDKEDMELVNDALGRISPIDETIPDDVLKIIKSKKKPTKKDQNVLDRYNRKILNEARERQDLALTKLPTNVANEITTLRAVIDNYSKEIVERGLGGAGKTSAAIDNKIGLYLTTDYEIFTNPKWLDKIKKASKGEVNDVEALQVVQGMKNHIKKTHKGADEIKVNEILDDTIARFEKGEEDFFKLFEPDRPIGQHHLGKIITGQKYIPSDLRKLMKEVDDPVSRVMSTMDKQGRLIAEHQFLTEIRDIALSKYGSKLFRTGSEFKGTGGVAKTTDENTFDGKLADIANDYIKTLGPEANPLVGVFTTKTYRDKLAKGLDFKSPQTPLAKALPALNAWMSGAQTVLSEATHLVNIQGNIWMSIANGNVMPFRGGIKEMLTYNPALNRLVNKRGGKLKIDIEEFKNLQQKGLINSGINQEFFYRSLEDAGFENLLKSRNKLLRYPSKFIDGVSTVYRAEDDVFKVYNYYQELNRYKKVFEKQLKTKQNPNGTMTQADLEEYAADVVKNTLPTYSRVPRALKGTRRLGVIGAFPSFTAESFRVYKNSAMIGVRDFLRGMKDGNAAMMQAGAERLAGLTAMTAVGSGAVFSNNEKNGIDEDDNSVIDMLSLVYDKGSSRYFNKPVMINPKTGHLETNFINISRAFPYDAPIKLVKAMYEYGESGQPLDNTNIDEIVEKVGQVFDPLKTESLAVESLINLLRGQDSYGNKKDFLENLEREVFNKAMPRTITDIYKATKAADSATGMSELGFPNRFEDRIKRFYGITQTTFDFNRSLQSKASENRRAIQEAEQGLRSEIGKLRAGTMDYSDPDTKNEIIKIVDEYAQKNFEAQKSLAETLYEFKKLNYYVKKGNKLYPKKITDQKVLEILTEKNLFKEPKFIRNTLARNTKEKNGIGIFMPSTLSGSIAKIFEKRDKIPPEIISIIDNRLYQWNSASLPLLIVDEE